MFLIVLEMQKAVSGNFPSGIKVTTVFLVLFAVEGLFIKIK